jgi:hypothetical protein
MMEGFEIVWDAPNANFERYWMSQWQLDSWKTAQGEPCEVFTEGCEQPLENLN